MILSFMILIEPKSVQHGSRFGKGRFYSDKGKVLYYDKIKAESAYAKPRKPLEGPLEFKATFYMPRPDSLPKSAPSGAFPCWSYGNRNDDDNLAKGLKDALGKAGFYVNDNQVWHGDYQRMYCEENGFPRIEVEITHEPQQL